MAYNLGAKEDVSHEWKKRENKTELIASQTTKYKETS